MASDRLLDHGSSPLTRGKLLNVPRIGLVRRLIPAHAGKTATRQLRLYMREAHPRSRGENNLFARHNSSSKGSSPLTRGKRTRCGLVCAALRLIPAHAGKTRWSDCPHYVGRAHPRSRGENLVNGALLVPGEGSSPLTRGKPDGTDPARQRGRLIPAHAGKTPARTIARRPRTAHPRSRGENSTWLSSTVIVFGSSPLTRGKPHSILRRPAVLRLIPAHAGKTHVYDRGNGPHWAHPRSRGENFNDLCNGTNTCGSSPLTRGKRWPRGWPAGRTRLIPAHAGKTLKLAQIAF